jgi:hypothetical protein
MAGAPGHCDGKSGLRLRGDFTTLTLIQCHGIEIAHARIGELRVLDSDVRLIDSDVRSGIYALRSQVEITGGTVSGEPALKLDTADVDAAGTRLESAGPAVMNAGATPAELRFSVAEVARRGRAPRYVHDIVSVAPQVEW